jgi:hypothetical protein
MTSKRIILISNNDGINIDLCGTIPDFTALLVSACDDAPHIKKAMELALQYLNQKKLENENR